MQSEKPSSEASGEEEEADSIDTTPPPSPQSHMGRKTIGVDYGLRRTGVCVSVGYAPRPLPLVVHDNNPAQVATAIAETVRQEGAEQIVVGLPLNTQGEEGQQANCTRLLIQELVKTCPRCKIFLWDERFSSSVAKEKLKEMGYHERDLKGTGMIDVVASIGILSDFFDKNGEGAEIVHTPSESDNVPEPPKRTMPTQSFKEWQKEMMAQAAASGGQKGKKKKKRK